MIINIFDVSKTIFQNYFSMMSEISTCYKSLQLKKIRKEKKEKPYSYENRYFLVIKKKNIKIVNLKAEC